MIEKKKQQSFWNERVEAEKWLVGSQNSPIYANSKRRTLQNESFCFLFIAELNTRSSKIPNNDFRYTFRYPLPHIVRVNVK